MKKILILLFFSLFALAGKTQITLDNTVSSTLYGYLFYPAKISATETKYVFLDTVNDKFSLYNLDFTPFLTNISVPHPLRFGDPSNTAFYHVMYITRTLFDCDSATIEYMFSAQNAAWNPFWIMRAQDFCDSITSDHTDTRRHFLDRDHKRQCAKSSPENS